MHACALVNIAQIDVMIGAAEQNVQRNLEEAKKNIEHHQIPFWRHLLEPCRQKPLASHGAQPTGAGDSIEQQKISFHIATKDERAKLEEKYPIGNYANFPNRRVYLDITIGFYYELNATRLRVWASAMARGFVTEKRTTAVQIL
ncbi:hypothetical protein B0H14DRAFT_2634821 [Mycena olivaceomarginata]|nr:hypothetical protein B0H14DRAFT_2634821 [Mycena olivaceomarginata]